MSENTYKFTVEKQWKEFCERVGLSEDKMPQDQRREMKRAFYGAWGQCLLFSRDEVAAHSETKAIQIMEGQFKEIANFWLAETKRQN